MEKHVFKHSHHLVCKRCGKLFSTGFNLKRHMATVKCSTDSHLIVHKALQTRLEKMTTEGQY